jgi:unsaturated rhamnogalacturonyl hydrolase
VRDGGTAARWRTSWHTNLTGISIGTNVGDYAFYIARPRETNDFHGLGAFLIRNEQLRTQARNQPTQDEVSQP